MTKAASYRQSKAAKRLLKFSLYCLFTIFSFSSFSKNSFGDGYQSPGSTQRIVSRPAFSSYAEARNWVRSNKSLKRDEVDTARSSWIRGASQTFDLSIAIPTAALATKGRKLDIAAAVITNEEILEFAPKLKANFP